jgi:4-hydroxybenzoate polyprenyltransferase
MRDLFRLLRPHQYIKNGFVFLGVLFGTHETGFLIQASIAFLAFCAASSSVYILNDILDVEADRRHPVKRLRPIAAGAVSVSRAWLASGLALLAALLLASTVGWRAVAFVLAYAVLNVGYSVRWKQIAVLDVFLISIGFMLRILIGTVGIGIVPSSWLLLCGMMITLFLGFAKRGAELRLIERRGGEQRGATREVLGQYGPAMVEQFTSISAACVIVSYSLYTVSPETVARHGTDHLIYTVPFVVYGVFRYVYVVHRRDGGNDAARDIYSDRQLLLTLLGWVVATLSILWR